MRKKELLSIRALNATNRMLELVEEDKEETETAKYTYAKVKTYHKYKRYQYYRATVEKDILKVAIFSRKHLAAGLTTPQFEVYISKEENTHLTYEPGAKKWRTGRIEALPYDLDDGAVYGNKPWTSERTKKMVNEFLTAGNKEVRTAIQDFQNQVQKNRLAKKHKSELEQIDEVMNAVPDLPKDFDEWVKESAFCHERYLIYQYGNKENEAYCTHCKQMVQLEKTPYHNQNGICPRCKTEALVKAWKKQKYLVDEKKVSIIQKLTDKSGYILRKFKCVIERRQEKNWEIHKAGCWEMVRIKLNKEMGPVESFEFGQYKNTGIERWCHEIQRNYYYGKWVREESILYHRNIKKLRKELGIRYTPIEDLLRKKQGNYCYPTWVMRACSRRPEIEYLIKAGMYNLAWTFCNLEYKSEIKEGARNLWDALGIKKEQIPICAKIDITRNQLKTLKAANENEVKLSGEQIQFFAGEVGPRLVENIFRYGHVDKFETYMKKLKKDGDRIGGYLDYLEDIRILGLPYTKDVMFPQNFQQAHQRAAEQRMERENSLRKKELEEKNRILKSMLPEVKEIYHIQDDTYVMVFPESKEDFIREGRENHNCVGGSYFDKMLKGESCVMFLRKSDDPDKAFCTVEMDGSRVLQCREKLNREPGEEVKKFMERYSAIVEKRIQKRERERMKTSA